VRGEGQKGQKGQKGYWVLGSYWVKLSSSALDTSVSASTRAFSLTLVGASP
jgi:hypothetical protein